MSSQTSVAPYDALLVVSFGGPERIDDVVPFLENVLHGRNVPRERLLEVAQHYELFGGVSPINEQNRRLIAKLKELLENTGPRLPIYFGNRNWHPLLADTVAEMRDEGIRRALAFVTSAYSSYSSCRQYLENIAAAQARVGPGAPQIDKIRPFYNHPQFIEANVAHVQAALAKISDAARGSVHLVFTAHSIPLSMAENCDYEKQLRETARLVAEQVDGLFLSPGERGARRYTVAYQSRSGPPTQPWLGPDISEHLRMLKAAGINDVVVAPIGFISDNMEVIYDLDHEAHRVCEEIRLNVVRAETAATHPAFIDMIRDLILERIDQNHAPRASGDYGPRATPCDPNCCLRGAN
jgi:ferrochelatase